MKTRVIAKSMFVVGALYALGFLGSRFFGVILTTDEIMRVMYGSASLMLIGIGMEVFRKKG